VATDRVLRTIATPRTSVDSYKHYDTTETDRAVPIATETSGEKKDSKQSNISLFLYFLKVQSHQQLINFLKAFRQK
jgi:hypothetical protein